MWDKNTSARLCAKTAGEGDYAQGGAYLRDTTRTSVAWHPKASSEKYKPNGFLKCRRLPPIGAWAYLKGFCLSPALFTHSRGTQMAVGVSMVANHTLTPLISTETPSLVTKV